MNTVYHGIESNSFFAPKIWNLLPNELKNIESSKAFKNRIKNCKPDKYLCGICKVYISNVGLGQLLIFYVFFGYCIIKFYLALLDFNLLLIILIRSLFRNSFSWIDSHRDTSQIILGPKWRMDNK